MMVSKDLLVFKSWLSGGLLFQNSWGLALLLFSVHLASTEEPIYLR